MRKFTHEDIDLIYEINNHPECIKFNGWESRTREKCMDDIEEWIEKYDDLPGTGAFCVERKNDKLKVGMAFIVKCEKEGEFEIGFRFRRAQWNKGYAKEITRGFMKYAKGVLNGVALIGEVHIENKNSRSLFEKLSFSMRKHPSGPDGLLYVYSL